MSNYFMMEDQLPYDDDVEGYIDIEDWKGDIKGFMGWRHGALARDRPTGSVEIDVVPHDGYTGLPPDLHDHSVPLMSARLKSALDSAGVDNIVYLPVVLRNPETGQRYDYFAFNLIGLVSATDFTKSNIKSPDGDFVGDSHIYDLKIDEGKTQNFLIFRLAEKFSAILVHRRVKEAIENQGINTLRFMEPEDYMAL